MRKPKPRPGHLLIYQLRAGQDWYWSWFVNKSDINTNDQSAQDHNGGFASPRAAFEDAMHSEINPEPGWAKDA